ncbi:MAG: hypothetical protein JJU12_03370 [Chlamydiales bacterium]|nr:hypothetical protein [Chlamydiales bacterium]
MSWSAVYFYNKITDGFSIRQMSSSLPPCPEFEVALSAEKKEMLKSCLSQPFRYIGKGCQFYVFESADGKYVLKFFKHKHLRSLDWLNSIPMPRKLREKSDAKIARRRERVDHLFSSCKLAYEEMSEETGLFYIHLNRVPALEKEVELIDKLGLKHRIAVDKFEYLIQTRAIPAKEAFTRVKSEEELRFLIEQLIAVVLARCEKGIADGDRAFVQNVAFSSYKPGALFIDTGQFYKEERMRSQEEQIRDLKNRLGNLRHWIEGNSPQYLPLVENFLGRVVN